MITVLRLTLTVGLVDSAAEMRSKFNTHMHFRTSVECAQSRVAAEPKEIEGALRLARIMRAFRTDRHLEKLQAEVQGQGTVRNKYFLAVVWILVISSSDVIRDQI